MSTNPILANFKNRYKEHKPEEMTITEYLELCKNDSSVYETSSERMLKAIGQPKIVDTSKEPRLSRIFFNRKIKIYPAFSDFYGMEEPIERIVSYFKHSAQGLEERKQILYLLGPVGGGKSSLAEKLKELIQNIPFYTIKAVNKTTGEWEISPMYESPLGLFNSNEDGELLEANYNIPQRYLKWIPSPWATKRLGEADGDLDAFKVIKVWPSILKQIGVTKTEPGDENNQDISALVGKVDIRKLEDFSQDDPDAYSYNGGLNVATQGMLEFVEMFKAPIKMLHPLLTATQEGNYNGTQGFGAMPFQGIVMAHSNQSEWETFKNNKNNEAFLDRVYIVKVPYCLRVTEEVKIYEKLLKNSSLSNAKIAPGTLEMMAQFSVLSRLKEPENSHIYSKLQVYDGNDLKEIDPKAKSYQEYKDYSGQDEAMTGLSTRFAYKILSQVFNYDTDEIAANPIHLMYILEKQIEAEQFPSDVEEKYLSYLKGIIFEKYATFISNELQKAYLESYSDYGQNIFDRYILQADYWIQNNDFRDPDTGEQWDRNALNTELEKLEKLAGVVNEKDFRNEVVNFVLRAKANNNGNNPKWTSYEKLRQVIEKKMFANTEDLLPVITFGQKKNKEEQKKHSDFIERMEEKGYTRKQVELVVSWYLRYKKNN